MYCIHTYTNIIGMMELDGFAVRPWHNRDSIYTNVCTCTYGKHSIVGHGGLMPFERESGYVAGERVRDEREMNDWGDAQVDGDYGNGASVVVISRNKNINTEQNEFTRTTSSMAPNDF
jgi:hypothetical protein